MGYVDASHLQIGQDQVAVLLTIGAFGSHLGVMFHMENVAVPQVMHLRFHQNVAVHNFSETEYRWLGVVLDLPAERSQILASVLDNLAQSAKSNRRLINFGPDARGSVGSVTSTGEYRPVEGSLGLTCSTFIAEALAGGGAPLVNVRTWPTTADNLVWTDRVCRLLRRLKESEAHITAIRMSGTPVRVLPEEVAAAAGFPFNERPLDYDIASAASVGVVKSLAAIAGWPLLKANISDSFDEAFPTWRMFSAPCPDYRLKRYTFLTDGTGWLVRSDAV